ncbi:hypothetical protein C4D60_Mb04t01880 [Musa balbisiana]|uniref:Uncharacterized protein n=1 Tax=Musa balbisiana TaxID=52838 RepID=A0A4S8K8Y6_MUSBA|nr:hypothetical protein C4D60_Mb04t01880 [Musa balbisiana]
MVDVLYQCLVEKQAEEKTCLLLVRFMQRREVLVSVVSATRSQKVLLLLKASEELRYGRCQIQESLSFVLTENYVNDYKRLSWMVFD